MLSLFANTITNLSELFTIDITSRPINNTESIPLNQKMTITSSTGQKEKAGYEWGL